jgi:16S rRNA G966 N2-methylase RsmD
VPQPISRTATGDGWCLWLGDCLSAELGLPAMDDQSVDVTLVDPPYGKRTHEGQTHERINGDHNQLLSSKGLGYEYLTPEQVAALSEQYVRVTRNWILGMTSHDLFPVWEYELGRRGHYVFAPIPIVIPGMNVRLQGDGPSNWSVWLVVARPRRKLDAQGRPWGTKQGAYTCSNANQDLRVKGSKPPGLLHVLVREYTHRGDVILDTHAGSGTTGVAALKNGRSFIGYEVDPDHFGFAETALQRTPFQEDLYERSSAPGKQIGLAIDDGKRKRTDTIDEVVFAKIMSAGSSGMLSIDLTQSVDVTKAQLRNALARLVKIGRVRCEGTTITRRYFLNDNVQGDQL